MEDEATWETHKENVQPLRQGRCVEDIEAVFEAPAKENPASKIRWLWGGSVVVL